MMKFKKVMSLILSVLIMIGVFSTATPVLAAETNAIFSEKEYQENLLSETVDSEEKKAEIVSEIPEKRGEYSKTYKRADGSFSTVYSQTPIHTFQNGEWKEIDNTLKSEGEILKNADGSFEIEFPETISENEKITVTNDGETIAFSVNNIESSSAVVSEPELNESDVIEKDLSKTVSEITYESIDENTDVQYIVSSDFVKENIIVSDKESLKAAYSFDIEKGSLNAVLDEDNNLEFRNEKNEIVFMIPAPVMKDSNNEASYDIDVAVENADKEALTLIYTPSAEWLNSRERSYPVTIDPVISIPSDNGSFISDTTIRDGDNINKNFVNDENGFICNTGENAEILVKFNIDGFEIFKSSNIVVTEANFVCGSISRSNSEILLKEIAQSWDVNSVTYASVYSGIGRETDFYCDDILDFHLAEENEAMGMVSFNITDLFNGWLRGEENNGFGLVPAEASETDVAVLLDAVRVQQSGTYRFNSVCVLDYVDTSGYNSSYEYLTQEIGRAGTARVNTFSRGLSLSRSDLGLSGNILPVDIAFNYDCGYNRLKDIFTDIFDSAELTASLCYGNKWVPSYIQALSVFTDTQYQAYTAEGTVLSFDLVSEVDGETTGYSFEEVEGQSSGYSLELISSGAEPSVSNIRLVSPEGYATYFNENGLAILICDAEDTLPETEEEAQSFKYIFIAYDSSMRIDYITDGVGRKYDFSYNEQGLLSEVNCLTAANEQIKAGTTETPLKVTYSYDSFGNLVRVTYPDGKNVLYNYESGNLVKVTNIDNYNISYSYDSLGKVTMITEKAGTTAGNFITLEELSNRQIKITDAYNGTETYQFGKNGQLHYTFDDKGNFCKSDYAPSKDENVYSSSEWEIASENLLENGSFEDNSPSNPSQAKCWSDNFERIQMPEPEKNAEGEIIGFDNSHFGDYACYLSTENLVNKFLSQQINVENSGAYTFSAYVKAINEGSLTFKITAINSSNGADVIATKTITSAEDWTRVSLTYKPSTNFEAKKIKVEVGFDNSNGAYYVDCAQLEYGYGTADFNLIDNGLFNNNNQSWSDLTIVNSEIKNKKVNAVKLNGGIPTFSDNAVEDSVSAITQNVKINGKKGDVYSVGGWFKGLFDDSEFSISEEQPEKSVAQIKVTYSYSDVVETTDESTNETTETQETVTENFSVNFAPNNDDWQYAVDSFVLKGDAESVDVTVIAKNTIDDSYITNLSLTKDSSGIVLEETEENEEEATEVCSCGCEDCVYGENCPCTGAINNDCQCPECLRKETSTEDSFGNTLSNKSTDGINYIETFSSYTADGNYLASYTDERGNVTTYDYNTLNGILESVTSPVGTENETTTTSYEYDVMGNVISVSTTASETENQTLQYVYNTDRLTEIITPNGKFKINYDPWGQVLSINVVTGTQIGVDGNEEDVLLPLVTYEYNSGAKRTQIKKVTYSNSSTNNNVYQYSYSDDGNVENIKLNNADKHNITYDNLGALTKIENVGGRTVEYVENGINIYNASGALVYTSVTSDDGLITEENYGIKYKEHEPEYDYNSATGSSTNTTALDIAKYYRVKQSATTDWFGREQSHLTTIYDITEETNETPAEAIGKIATEYHYPVASDGKTSQAIEKFVNKTYNGDSESVRVYDGYYYEYDKQNKISAEKTLNADGTTTDKYSYEYDKLGQLVRFNDAVENKTYTYTYDNNGNILTKSEYAYTTGDLGTATKTTTYGYDTQWKDKLTTVGDKTITYDNIGNPTSYLGATLTWEGRNLKSYETEEQKLQYEYDENGMRYRTTITNKEDNSVGYLDYVWVDSKLISISFTSDGLNQTVKYLYNDFDEPVGFVSTREDGSVDTYYYLKNAQGDITNIVSAAGKKMVSFTYDVFGKRTVEYQANDSTTPSHIELLTQIKADLLNPFAYRGYCYDYDMGMYYLQSRYYDPNTGRFINADDTNYLNATGTVLGCNLFAYCENDGVNFVDEDGFISDKVAMNMGYIRRTKTKNVSKTVCCLNGTFKVKVEFSYLYGYNNGRKYAKLKTVYFKIEKVPTQYKYVKTSYTYGTTNILYSQNIYGETSKKTFSATAPNKWLGVNTISTDEIKAMVGISVYVYLENIKNKKIRYELYFLLTTKVCEFTLFKINNKKCSVVEFY